MKGALWRAKERSGVTFTLSVLASETQRFAFATPNKHKVLRHRVGEKRERTLTPMKFTGHNATATQRGGTGAGGGGRGRNLIVGVKLDPWSRELLTWTLLKVAEPGDVVIALHAVSSENAASMLSLVKAFDSVLGVYEGFCHLKQVELKLKVCRGTSARKLLVQEAESLGADTVILGTSQSFYALRSSAAIAKYCAKKLPKCVSVFAVDSGKVAFRREATVMSSDQVKLNASPSFISKSLTKKRSQKSNECCVRLLVLPDSSTTTHKEGLADSHRQENSLALVPIQKPDDASNYSIPVVKSDCSKPDSSAALPKEGLNDSQRQENSLALVPIQKPDDACSYSNAVVKPDRLKHGWLLLRQVFLPKRNKQKSLVKNTPSFHLASGQPNSPSAVVHVDEEQNIDPIGNCKLDAESGAIVPYESDDIATPSPLFCHSSVTPEELLALQEKYSSSCKLYSFQELVSATANFSSENLVGIGGCSHVYRGCLAEGKELAIKILKPSENAIKDFVKEIEIVTTLHHKNIISLSGFCIHSNNLLLVSDLLSRGSLEENLYGNKNDCRAFGWQERYKVAVGVAEALNHLHNRSAHPVIHRDVKSSNILLSDDFEPQLSDFGLASWGASSSHTSTDVAGTFGYLAPEYFMHGKVTDKIDVYAFGVVLLELLSSKKPINNVCPKVQQSLVTWATPILKEGKLSELLDPSLGSDYNHSHIQRMVLAATLCIRRSFRWRPHISLILKLLQGVEEVIRWAEEEVNASEELDRLDGEPVSIDIQSHLSLALLDIEDDTDSISSTEQFISTEDYFRRRCSRSSSFA
ncbi:Receptor-like cytosolic serine/threonine-protein kinase [Arachis hypogaea]|nr:Receptor-like cytosolic serine/threonine-protein kinase [Arachis hypogaea]